ncbi:MAG TPA: STAS/SEC14 domain-containing protein [Gammaproteobacteria bacterium]|nr:STAS/SEC14 domain-containing protein [Gammaproteobacteria bacterium]
MIEPIPLPADNVVGFRIDGKIDADDISRIADVIEARLERYPKLRVYAEVDRVSGVSVAAFVKDITFSLRHLKDIEREAIVSDTAWLKKLAGIGDRMLPSIEVRHFSKTEKDRALEWIIDPS